MTSDERIARMEKWLRELYSTAEKEMRGKWDKYLAAQEKRAETLLSKVKEAKTDFEKQQAEKKYRMHMQSITNGDKRFREIVDDLAQQYANAGTQATKMIYRENLMSYIDGYNKSAREINSLAIARDIGIRFDLIDQNTIAHLGEHAEDLLLPKKDPEKAAKLDLTVWNVHNINAQVTQGIVQGEGCDKIAARLENVTHMNEVASIRTARTMVTGARNAGHLQNMKTAERWGVHAEKQWNCHHDSRTRDSHWELDRMTIPLDDTFPNGCAYPGDPSGPASEVYNCRCGLLKKNVTFSSNLPKGKENAIHIWIDGEQVK